MKDGGGGIHWYGKSDTRLGRKMGHVTFAGKTVDEVIRRHPNIKVEVLPPVGEDPRFAALLRDIATESARD